MTTKKAFALLLSATVLTAVVSGCGGTASTATPAAPTTTNNTEPTQTPNRGPVRLTMGGNNSSTTTYVIAVAYGEILNTNMSDFSLTVEETGGGYEVLNQIISGELDIATASDAPAYQAAQGTGKFEGVSNSSNFYTWMPVYLSPVQPVVLADSPINSISELKGCRVGIDTVGTGSEAIHRGMFEYMGWEDGKDITLVNSSKADMLAMLKTGELDCAMITTAAPVAALVEFGTTTDYKLINMTDEEVSAYCDYLGYMAPYVMKAGTYDKIDYDLNTMALYTSAYISTELDDELVYDMTKCLWEHTDRLETAHSSQALLSGDMVRNAQMVKEFHPGAARYYREQGWIS